MSGAEGIRTLTSAMVALVAILPPFFRRLTRADERTRTADLLITSVRSMVAEGCTGLQILHR
jgi:hypothetical protein